MDNTDADSDDSTKTDTKEPTQTTQPVKKRGRPRKSAVEAKKRGSRGTVGRPKGDAAIINEMKARMLASPKSRKVLDSIMNAALDDEHKNQSAAWKLLMDRMLPVSYFEKDKESNTKPSVNITISGVGDTETVISGSTDSTGYSVSDAIEGEYTNEEE